jgi:glucose/arabinose dehydrogenase
MVNFINGDNGANTRTGTGGADVIYGFDPEGPQRNVSKIDATRVATGLDQPLFASAPNGDLHRLFVVEKGGLIKILNLDTHHVLATPFLNVSAHISTDGEGGLLGLAFDPNFAQNHFVYVDLTNTNGDTEVRRFHVSNSNPNRVDAGTGKLIIRIDQPDGLTNHKAGWIDFGPDGKLYIALGDGGGAGDPNGNAQNLNSLLGKMLRIDVNGDDFPSDANANYAIPSDNPFVGVAGRDEIWALGLRNPFRDSFDRADGKMFIGDVGQNTWEEIDIGQNGANYGWNRYEGPADFNTGTTLGGGTLTAPIHFYDHTVGNVIIGGYAYRGSSEGLQGQYFFADEGAGKLFTLHFNGSSWVATNRTAQLVTNAGHLDAVSSFGQDGAGNLYATDIADGEVFRLTPRAASADQADMLRGLGGADQMYGGPGNDHLDGGPGADFLNGGRGTDYADFTDAGAGVHANLANQAGNTGDAKGDVYVLIEGLIGSRFNDVLTGHNVANGINASTINDRLFGGKGNDTLNGLTGNDFLLGGPGADALHGDQGIDTASYLSSPAGVSVKLARSVQSGGDAQGDKLFAVENLVGSNFADTLGGNSAANVLRGLDGRDLLSGGPGGDRFDFNAPSEAGKGPSRDQILDFSHAQHDRIDVRDIDANVHAAGNQTFQFIGAAGFHSHGDHHVYGELRYANHVVQGDVNGDGHADFEIHVNASTLAKGDFLL